MDQLGIVPDKRVPGGTLLITKKPMVVDTSSGFTLVYPDLRKSVLIYNISTEVSDYPGADWIHQTGKEDPYTERTLWHVLCWLLVLGIIAFPLWLVIEFVVTWIGSALS